MTSRAPKLKPRTTRQAKKNAVLVAMLIASSARMVAHSMMISAT